MKLGFVERSPHWASVLGAFHRYEVLGRMGSGGMAEVFLVREKEPPHRKIAVKRLFEVLSDEADLRSMFVDEARLGMRLTHPNLCRFYDVGEVEGQLCIAMEYIEGVTLADLIDRCPQGLPRAVALSIIVDVASALVTVHGARDERGRKLGIVHRDVSPRNIMVGYDGRARLLDFGIAKSVLNESITRPGMAKGKFAYMAPELWREDVAPDPRSDVFSLGVCLYEALTGVRLYHRASPLESKSAICDDPVPSLRPHQPKVPEALDRVVKRAIAKRPEDRFESALMMERVLAELMTALRLDNEGVGRCVRALFEEERLRGPELEPTTFGVTVRAPTEELFKPAESVNPSLAPPSVPPLAPRRLAPYFIAGGIALGALVGIAAVLSLGEEPAPRVETAAIEAPPPPAAVEAPPPPPVVEAPAVVQPVENVVVIDEVPVEVAPLAMGRLSVNTRPWSEVFVDGRSIGTTPIGELEIAAGRHELTFVDADGNRTNRRIEVPADGEAQIFEDLRPAQAPVAEAEAAAIDPI